MSGKTPKAKTINSSTREPRKMLSPELCAPVDASPQLRQQLHSLLFKGSVDLASGVRSRATIPTITSKPK